MCSDSSTDHVWSRMRNTTIHRKCRSDHVPSRSILSFIYTPTGTECSVLQICTRYGLCTHLYRLKDLRLHRYTNTFVTNLLSRATLKDELRRAQEYRAARYLDLPASALIPRTSKCTPSRPANSSIYWVLGGNSPPTDAIGVQTHLTRSKDWEAWNAVSTLAS